MKKILFLLLLVNGLANGQVINFPDANFKAKLLSASASPFNVVARNAIGTPMVIDTNANGQIEQSEALGVYWLSVRNAGISNVTGISFFTNLESLDLDFNPLLTNLSTNGLGNLQFLSCYNSGLLTANLTSSPNLKQINFSNNDLSALDLSGLSDLEHLTIAQNQLNSLNVTGLSALLSLNCSDNAITVLDINSLTNLVYLNCANNLLSTLSVTNVGLEGLIFGNPGLAPVDVNNLVNLTQLDFKGGVQTTMDISNLIGLELLTISGSNLTTIDASNNPGVLEFFVTGNPDLTYINVKDGSIGNYVFVATCPNLTAICANEQDAAGLVAMLTNQGNTTVSVTSYCSFTPGGNYNTIGGTIKYDFNNSGCSDDNPQPLIKININDGTQQGSSFTNNTGNYVFYTSQPGNYTITPQIENPTYFTVNPINATVNFPVVNNTVATHNFCITANGIHPDVEIVIAPIIPARPGFDAVYKIVYKNKGNQVISGNLFFEYDDTVLDLVSSNPVQDNTLQGYLGFNYTNLMPFENREITITLNVNGPTETPAINIDDVLEFNATITLTGGTDENPSDNVFNFDQVVVGAYDPNDKECIEGNMLDAEQIGEYLHYLIRFENTGNFNAENIVVKDVIDPTQFDINSLRVLNSSHAVEVKVTGNIAEFIFKNIYLDTGGHGNILLKVRTLQTLPVGTTVANKADIFFDYNFPIQTNTASTSFEILGVEETNPDLEVSLYPNPTVGTVSIKTPVAIETVQLYDVQGRILSTTISKQPEATIDLSGYASGVYYLVIATEKGTTTAKVIRK